MHAPLADFTTRLLTRHGALLEQESDGIGVVVPPALAAVLEVGEYQRFAFDRRSARSDALVIDHESPLVERFERLVARLGRIACVPPPRVSLKAIDADEVVGRAVTLTNGVFRDCRTEAGNARYVGFLVEYELLADERISGMMEVWVNTTTGSVPRLPGAMARLLSSEDEAFTAAAPPTDEQGLVTDAWTSGAALARVGVQHRLHDALASLRRRRERDFTQVREYYEGIDQEIRARARRAMKKGDAPAVTSEGSRLEATAQAFRGRAADLVDRYRVRVRIEPLVAVICTLPVHVVSARVHRRTASRALTLAWNPLDRALELPRCDGCGSGTSAATLCDERVHVICRSCERRCDACARPYCVACHPRCPRPHR